MNGNCYKQSHKGLYIILLSNVEPTPLASLLSLSGEANDVRAIIIIVKVVVIMLTLIIIFLLILIGICFSKMTNRCKTKNLLSLYFGDKCYFYL